MSDANTPDPIREASEPQDRQKTFARRALIQAGWVLPAVAVFGLPKDLAAASAHNDGAHQDSFEVPHTDDSATGGHSDAENHSDVHDDNGNPHGDGAGPHFDTVPGHTDSPVHFDGADILPHADTP